MNNYNKIWNLETDTYNKLSTSHSKANIFLWVIGGLIYNLFCGNLLSLSSALVIFPGIFIASFASIPTFWVEIKKKQIVPKTNNIFILTGFTIWYIFDLVYPILISILFIQLVNKLFSFLS